MAGDRRAKSGRARRLFEDCVNDPGAATRGGADLKLVYTTTVHTTRTRTRATIQLRCRWSLGTLWQRFKFRCWPPQILPWIFRCGTANFEKYPTFYTLRKRNKRAARISSRSMRCMCAGGQACRSVASAIVVCTVLRSR